MTKEEIDRLFEIYDNEELEELLDIIKDDKLKEKAMQYDDLEEFFEEEEDNIVIAIYSQIPPELLDYFCEKAIISSNAYLICDEQIREEQIKRFETKVEEIIKSDDDTKIKFLENLDDYNKYAIKIAQTLSDEKKLEFIGGNKSAYVQSEVAKKITDSAIKLKAIPKIKDNNSYCIPDVVLTIQDETVRLDAMDYLDDDFHRAKVAVTIEDSEIKLKSLDKIDKPMYKAEVAVTIGDSEIKLKSLDKIDDPMDKVKVAVTIEDSEIKLKSLDKIDEPMDKAEVAVTIGDSEIKLKSLDKIKDSTYRIDVAKSIKDIEIRLQSTEKFEEYKYKKEIMESFSEEEIMELSEKTFSEDKKDIADLVNEMKNNIIIKNTFQNALKKLEEKDTSFKIGLPEDMTIGVELETEGDFGESLKGKEIASGWIGETDISLDNGIEVVSPVLHDTEEDMKNLEAVCNAMSNLGLGTTKRCGGHIHIGADYLKDNPQAFENFLTIWNECEELFYKMGNEKGNVPRDEITKWARTSHSDLEQFSSGGTVNVKSNSDIENIRTYLVNKERKYRGLNLGHYGEEGKNTIEFRIPNGTINPKTVKENIKLFGSLMQISKEMALNPEYKKEEFETLMYRGLTEGEKVEALLNLLFDDEQTKSIYRERWDSVKDEKIFDELTAGQTPTFERGNYRIENKQDIKEVVNSQEAIVEMSGVAEEVKREEKERKQQSQLSKDESIDNNDESR